MTDPNQISEIAETPDGVESVMEKAVAEAVPLTDADGWTAGRFAKS